LRAYLNTLGPAAGLYLF